MKQKVKFLRPWNGYNPGEIAGFAPHIAASLCDGDNPAAARVASGEAAAPAAAEPEAAPNFEKMKKAELVAYAEENGFDSSGTAAELRERLSNG